MTDYRDTLDPHADSKAQKRQIQMLTSMAVTVDTGTSYTYVLEDANGYKRHNNAAAITATVPPNSLVAFPVGTRLSIEQMGVGQVTVAAGVGVTIHQPASLTLALNEQWSFAAITKVGTNEWVITGGLASSFPEAPSGFAYIVNADGAYLINADDAYILAKV